MATKKARVPGEGDDQAAPDVVRSDTPPPDSPMVHDAEWTSRTWQEAMAAGVDRAVLCKNGWYVPETAGAPRPALRVPQER